MYWLAIEGPGRGAHQDDEVVQLGRRSTSSAVRLAVAAVGGVMTTPGA
jgi:hypothetical protein